MSIERGSLTVRNITNELVAVENWEVVGVNLGISHIKLSEIRSSRGGNGPLCKISMADTWLRSDIDASWEKLVKALEDTGNEVPAENIRTTYIDGDGGGAAGYSGGGASGYGRRTATPSSAGSQIKRPRVTTDGPSGRSQAQAPSTPMDVPVVDVRALFERAVPSEEEGSKMEQVLHTVINNVDDINAVDDLGGSLLHSAIQKGDIVSMKTLIALGANVNLHNSFNLTALDAAVMMHPQDKEMSQTLRDVGGVSNMPPQQAVGLQQMETGAEEQTMSRDGDRVLCLDNSSTMALVQLELLNQIELATGKKITELFQWIVASGIGGLLMLLMVYGNKTISDLRRFYFRLYDRVFADPQSADVGKELEAAVIDELGDVATPGDCVYMDSVKEPKLLIGAVNKRTSTLDLKFFSNCPALADGNRVHVWKVARYTCSSPLYFGEHDNYIDTGVVCKNLCGVGLEKINSYYEKFGQNIIDPISMVVSLGDGHLPAQQLGSTGRLSTLFLRSNPNTKGLLPVFQNLVALYTSAANYQSEEISTSLCQRWCESRHITFLRFNPLLGESIPVPEEASIKTLINVVIHTISHVASATGEGKDKIKAIKDQVV